MGEFAFAYMIEDLLEQRLRRFVLRAMRTSKLGCNKFWGHESFCDGS